MNLTKGLAALGMGDGENNTSSHRVISMMVVAAWLVTKVYASLKAGTPMTIEATEVALIGTILGLGAAKTVAEQTTVTVGKPKPVEPQTGEPTTTTAP